MKILLIACFLKAIKSFGMIRKVVCLSLLVISFMSCSEKKEQVKIDDYIVTKEKEIVIEEYSNNALEILTRHKEKNLQVVLPNIIYDQVKIYENLLIEYEKKQTYANSDLEFLSYKEEADNQALISLLMKDVEINLAYNEFLGEIEDLNIAYAEKYNIDLEKLESFYDLDNIILSEEVLLKIQEFSRDEKKRVKLQENEDMQALGVDGIVIAAGLIPGGSLLSKGVIRGISHGAKLAKQGKTVAANAPAVTKLSYNLMSTIGKNQIGSVARNKVTGVLSNEVKRQVLAEKGLSNAKRIGTGLALSKTAELVNVSPAKVKRSKDFFKVIENKLEGRVGDYTDGILAVHLQNARELIKKNQMRLSELKK